MKKIALLAERHGVNLFIAVGGGSVIDAAKAGLLMYEKGMDYDPTSLSPFDKLGLGRKAKLVAVPTTSGTGSDASFGIVLTRIKGSSKRKIAVGNYELVPYATILDPSFTVTMPVSLTRNTALDALAHAVEAYVAVMANPFSDALAEKAVEIIVGDLPIVLTNPGDIEARRRLHMAATMAGMAFTAAGLGLAHAIAHAIGPKLQLHHGLAVSLVLPYVVEYNMEHSETARNKYTRLSEIMERKGYSGELDKQLKQLYKTIGHPTRISELEKPLSQDEWESIVGSIALEALADPELAFNPVPIGQDDIEALLRKMY